MIVIACLKGNPKLKKYGLKVRREDRDQYCDRAWPEVIVHPHTGIYARRVAVDESSFMDDHCGNRSRRPAQVGGSCQKAWPWPKGTSPLPELHPEGKGNFGLRKPL